MQNDFTAQDICALHQLCAEYLDRADHLDGRPVCDLFTAAGALTLGSLAMHGRDEIARFFDERRQHHLASKRYARHISGSPAITVESQGRARLRSTAVVFAATGSLPLAAALPSTICDFHDICLQSAPGQWLFETRRAEVIFTGAGAPSFAR